MEAFVYCWTDHKTNMLYVGYHKGSIDDGYICSSKLMMKEYSKRPNDFTRQIISIGSARDMRKLETKILESVNAQMNEHFYNQHNGNDKFVCTKHSEETKEKFRKIRTGRKHSEETKQKMRDADRPTVISEETRKKQSESAKKRASSVEEKKRLQSIAHLATKSRLEKGPIVVTEETKKKVSLSIKQRWSDGAYNNRSPRSDKGKKRK